MRLGRIVAFRRHREVKPQKVMRLGTRTFVSKLRVGRLHLGVIE